MLYLKYCAWVDMMIINIRYQISIQKIYYGFITIGSL